MRVMSEVTDPEGMHTMTTRQAKLDAAQIKALVRGDADFVRTLVRTTMQEVLEAEMSETLGAAKGERTPVRLG
jgi:putative transposase